MTIAQRMTLEAFLRLPEEEPALEFADGMVTQKVSPKFHHSALQYALAALLNIDTDIIRALLKEKYGKKYL